MTGLSTWFHRAFKLHNSCSTTIFQIWKAGAEGLKDGGILTGFASAGRHENAALGVEGVAVAASLGLSAVVDAPGQRDVEEQLFFLSPRAVQGTHRKEPQSRARLRYKIRLCLG